MPGSYNLGKFTLPVTFRNLCMCSHSNEDVTRNVTHIPLNWWTLMCVITTTLYLIGPAFWDWSQQSPLGNFWGHATGILWLFSWNNNPCTDFTPLFLTREVVNIIVSQLFSQTRHANYSGQRELAERNSKTARTLNHVAVALGIICTVLFFVYMFVLNKNI